MQDFGVTQQLPMSDKTMITPTPASGGQVTVMGTPVKCPVCATENAPTEKYCGECGFLLSSTPGEPVEEMEQVEQAKLVAADGREFFLRVGENTVGRENADVLFADPTISRRHALITFDGGKYWVEDLGSTNGTFVDRNPVAQGQKVELADGMEVKFGSAVLTVAIPQTNAQAAETPETGEKTIMSTDSESPEPEVVPEAQEPVVEPAAENPVFAHLASLTDPSMVFDVVSGVNTVGRRAGNDIVISNDMYVSGAHAQVVVDELGVWLIDTGSTNGTLLNGTRIAADSRMALNSGDEVTFGKTVLRFEVAEPAETSEPEAADEPTN